MRSNECSGFLNNQSCGNDSCPSGSQSSGSQSSGIGTVRRSSEYFPTETCTSPPKPIKKRKVHELEVKIEPDILMDISEVKQDDIKTEIDDVTEDVNQIVDNTVIEEESSEYDNVSE